MKVKDLTAYFSSLDQEAEVMFADYYYDAMEGWSKLDQAYLPDMFYLYGEVLYVDTNGVNTDKDGKPYHLS